MAKIRLFRANNTYLIIGRFIAHTYLTNIYCIAAVQSVASIIKVGFREKPLRVPYKPKGVYPE